MALFAFNGMTQKMSFISYRPNLHCLRFFRHLSAYGVIRSAYFIETSDGYARAVKSQESAFEHSADRLANDCRPVLRSPCSTVAQYYVVWVLI